MFGLGKSTPSGVCALVLDIGSGSVGMAIVSSNSGEKKPEIIWSHREFTLMRELESEGDSLKLITTAIVNAYLELANNGLKTLKQFNENLHITEVKASVSAPWSFTVTKTVCYTDEHPFSVTEDLVDQLSDSAKTQTNETFEQRELSGKGLTLITDKIVDTRINGYPVKEVSDQEGREVEISHVTALLITNIFEVITESTEKILPKAELTFSSFMYSYFNTLRQMHPDTSEVCLIDVTKEATEIGIVRDGVLRYTTHAPHGSFTLAREIAKLANLPKEEAFAVLKNDNDYLAEKLPPEKLDQLMAIFSTYELKISSLLHETGDSLSIPETIFLHCDIKTEDFFTEHIKKGAKAATNSNHTVHKITSKVFDEESTTDSGIALSAYSFHLEND